MNVTQAIECSEGHQYLLKLTDCKNLPIEIDIEIVDIALVPVSKPDTINNAGTLNRIASILFNFGIYIQIYTRIFTVRKLYEIAMVSRRDNSMISTRS